MIPLLGRNSPIVLSTLLRQSQGIMTPNVVPAIQTAQWCRNGKVPNALFESMKSQSGNYAAVYRTKEICSWGATGTATGSDTVYRRWAFHTGPFTTALSVLISPYVATVANGKSMGARLDLTPGDGSGTVSTSYLFGIGYDAAVVSPYATVLTPVTSIVTVKPDTDYTAAIVCTDFGGIAGAAIGELASLTEVEAGYLPENFAQGSNIYADTRGALAELASAIFKRGAAQVMNYWGPISYSSTTPGNLFETSVSTISPTSIGPYLDFTGKARLANNGGVNAVVAVYGTAASGADSLIDVMDQNGNTIAEVDLGDGGGTGWGYTTCTFPATLAKYDIQIRLDGGTGTMSVDAVSIYEYE
ncbi:MAG TPA: hypothetical protein VGG74_11830 [Kofleriaceae bacterium]|jgi:hypothetical protein